MIDVSPKFKTLRYAMAKGTLFAKPEIVNRVIDRTVPKGDVLEVARAAGINAAKRCADWMVFCHTSLWIGWVLSSNSKRSASKFSPKLKRSGKPGWKWKHSPR